MFIRVEDPQPIQTISYSILYDLPTQPLILNIFTCLSKFQPLLILKEIEIVQIF